MISSNRIRGEKRTRPFCQTTGCFDLADVYVVLKETEDYDYCEISSDTNYEKKSKEFKDNTEYDGFKLILYLCKRHDEEFKYLIKGSELKVSKRCDLHIPELHEKY